jgi:DNA-binding winged helix-turn-helix (wHTH) protein
LDPKFLLRFATMPRLDPERYSFGEFAVDVAERRLWRGTAAVPLPPKAFEVLLALIRKAGLLVEKRDLLATVWPDTFVEESILTVHVATLRKRLADTAKPAIYIETVARFGYRFTAPVTAAADGSDGLHAPAACALVECGRRGLLSGSYDDLRDAVEAFQAAVAVDAHYAVAYAGWALARCAQAQVRSESPQAAYDDAKRAALRALALDDRCADAQLALGTVLFLSEWDWVGAERSFRRALSINAQYTEAYLCYGNLLDAVGRVEEGLRMKQRALECEPASPVVFVQMAISHWNQRQYYDTITWARRALQHHPRQPLAWEYLSSSYYAIGDIESFIGMHIERAEVFDGPTNSLAEAMRHARGQDRHTAVRRYLLDTDRTPAAGGASVIRLAAIKAAAGDTAAALRHLDAALADRDAAVVYLGVSPLWDGLRSDPRFEERLARLGLPLYPSVNSAPT